MLAQLIKKGAPEYTGLPTDLAGKVNHVKVSWEKELKLHFENEEKILLPLIKGKSDEMDMLIQEILADHEQIKSLVFQLDTSNEKEKVLNELGVLLELHIRKEERKLFKKIQDLLPETLDMLEGKITAAKNSCKL